MKKDNAVENAVNTVESTDNNESTISVNSPETVDTPKNEDIPEAAETAEAEAAPETAEEAVEETATEAAEEAEAEAAPEAAEEAVEETAPEATDEAEEETAEDTAPEGKKGKKKKSGKGKKVFNTILNVVLVAALVFAAVCTYISFVSADGKGVPSFFGVKILSVQTDSMEDTIMPGDLIVDFEVKDAADLKKGDIITYWTIIKGKRVLNTHRIVDIYDGGNFRIFETQGDNSSFADPLTVHESEIEGKYLFRIPAVGFVVDYMQTPLGFFLVVVLPVLIFFIYHLIQFFRVLFEYQNVKMLIKYEQERGTNEDVIAAAVQDEQQQEEIRRAAYEAELREKLRAELLEDLEKEKAAKKEESDTEK